MSDQPGGVVAGDRAAMVRRSVTVDVDRDRAFEIFTAGFDSWWLRSHSVGATEMAEAVIEPRAGGRWYERGVDGSECDWGHVIVWEPPGRLVLAWQLDGRFQFDPELVTEVEVTFTAETPDRTRVELEHRNLDRMGDDVDATRATFESDGGWPGLLARYAEEASRSD